MSVRVGLPVPDVEFEYYQRGEGGARQQSLHGLRGEWVVLFFYPRDFTFICPTEIAEFGRLASEFAAEDAVVVGASTDSYFTHKAWYETDERLLGVDFPVVADTSHALSEAFDVLLPDGATLRGTFVIDPDGVLRHMSINEHDVGRNVEESLRVLKALRTGELCPVAWRPGEDVLATHDDYFARAFPRLTPRLLAQATESARVVSYPAGATIIDQGEPADGMYVVRSGEVDVVRRRSDGGESVIATLQPGDHFGEMGLLSEAKRTAAVRATSEVELLELPADAFRMLTESSHEMASDLKQIVEARMAGLRAVDPSEVEPVG